MKLKYALPVIIIIFLLAGCSTGLNRAAPPSGNTVPLPLLEHEYLANDTLDKEAIMASYRQNQHGTAERMAQLYVDAIKNGLDLANDEDAIAVFDLLFNRQTLAVANLRPDDYMPDGYQCDLAGSGPNGDRIVPLFIIFQEDNPRFFCPLAHYGVQSRRSVETYLNYLAAGDAPKLSQWLSIDGGSDEFLDEANRLMEHYRQYDLSKTEIVNFDYNHEIYRFVYHVQDGNEEMFEVFMSYGDGFSMPDIYSVLD
jgi:hypothetical protein